jgi:hypothetical protein
VKAIKEQRSKAFRRLDGTITDVCDGEFYSQRIKDKFIEEDNWNLTLVLNTDGAKKHKVNGSIVLL